MIFLRFAPRLVFTLASVCTLALSAVLAAPPPAIASLVGEWSGESSRTATGEPAARPFSDARRYWVDGDAVRGEILVGAGNSLQTVHVTIVPRLGYFLKSVTAENGRTDILVGLPAEDGVLWTPVSGDKNRFVERVAGDPGQRRLELLVPEGDSANPGWRVSEALQPAAGAMSGVVGGGVAGPDVTAPLQLPPDSELALIDRVADLQQQRDAARGETANLARELAAAWHESETAGTRAKSLEAELAELKSTLPAAATPAQSDDAVVRLEAAEKDALAARRWADELEKSLRGATAKAEEAAARADALNAELTAAQSRLAVAEQQQRDTESHVAATTVADPRIVETEQALQAATALVAQRETELAKMQSERDADRARVVQLEQQLAAASAGTASDAPARLAAVEQDLLAARAELATAATQRAQLEQDLSAAVDARKLAEDHLASATSERDAAREQATVARAQSTQTDQGVRDAQDARQRAELQLAAAVSERDVARTQVAKLEAQIESWAKDAPPAAEDSSKRVAALERELETMRGQLATATTQGGAMENRLRMAADAQARSESDLVEVRQTLADEHARTVSLEAQLADARKATAPEAADAARRAGLEAELAAARGEIALGETRRADLERELQAARVQSDSAVHSSQQADAELRDARLRVAELETELTAERSRVAAAERERPRDVPTQSTDERVADLETRLAESVASTQQRQDEIDRLTVRVRELESGTPARVAVPATAIAASAPATRASDSPTQERRVAAAPPTAPVRPPPRNEVATATPTAPAADASVGFRLAPAPTGTASAPRLPPTRPSDNRVYVVPAAPTGGDSTLAGAVRALPINGYRRAGPNSVVIIGGHPFKPGEVVDANRGLRFSRIDSDAIVFTGPAGTEYRFPL